MVKCVWDRLRRVSWWQWIALLAAAIAIALLIYYAGPILASVGIITAGASLTGFLALLGITLPAWVVAALVGLGSTLGLTILLSISECARKK